MNEKKDSTEPKNKKNVKGPSFMERYLNAANQDDEEDN